MQKPLISIVTPCYNESENVDELIKKVREETAKIEKYRFEHIFIDNASTDNTVEILKGYAAEDKSIKLIVNSMNFGHIRSPYYGLLQARGEAAILMVSDLQDPPEMISTFIQKWEEGHEVVIGVKDKSLESPLMFLIRKMYYSFIEKLSEVKLVKNYTGFGLYDKKIIKHLREMKDPYPYFRGLVMEIGFNVCLCVKET